MLGQAPSPATINVHATCVAVDKRGILLLGPSGSGKSDLALRLIDRGADLVADDRCDLWLERGQLWCRAPVNLAGKLEVRGIGIVDKPFVAAVPVLLAVRFADIYERMPPEGRSEWIAGVAVPSVNLSPFELTAPLKILFALGQMAPQ